MAQKKKLGARGHWALLEHSPEFGGELETTHSLQLYKKNQNMDFSMPCAPLHRYHPEIFVSSNAIQSKPK